MSESMSCWICATIESALDDMAVLLLHNRWVVLPIIAQSRRSFNATMFTCRFRIRPHGLWSHSNDFLISVFIFALSERKNENNLQNGKLFLDEPLPPGWLCIPELCCDGNLLAVAPDDEFQPTIAQVGDLQILLAWPAADRPDRHRVARWHAGQMNAV